MSTKVIIVTGSPRNGGNTEFCARRIFDRLAQEDSINVRFYRLTDYNIKRCAGCRACMKKYRCVIDDDDFPAIMDEVLASDIIVLAAPVFWNSPPGIMKDFIDRTHGYYAVFPRVLMGKKGFIISVAADGPFESHEDAMSSWLISYGVDMRTFTRIIAREIGDAEGSETSRRNLDEVAEEIIGIAGEMED